MLAGDLGEILDYGSASYQQIATHVTSGATLGTSRGEAIEPSDAWLDRVLKPAVPRGPFSVGNDTGVTRATDVNADGLPDLVSITGQHLLAQVLRPDGTYGDRVFTDVAEQLGVDSCINNSLATGDVNGDSQSEAFIVCDGSVMVVAIDENGVFSNKLHQAGSGIFNMIHSETADLNNDGFLDFVFVSAPGDLNVGVLLGDEFGQLTLIEQTSDADAGVVRQALVKDIDRDGNQDLVFAFVDYVVETADYDQSLWVQKGNGDGTFRNAELIIQPDSRLTWIAFDAADVDQDGAVDLIVSDFTQALQIWYQELGEFRSVTAPLTGSVRDFEVIETGDNAKPIFHVLSVVPGDPSYQQLSALRPVTDSSFQTVDSVFMENGSQIQVAELTGDAFDDVLVTTDDAGSDPPSRLAIYASDQALQLAPAKFVTLIDSPAPVSGATADFNEDGFDDVVYTHHLVDHLSMVMGGVNDDGHDPVNLIRQPLEGDWSITDLIAIDFNSDGHMDLVGRDSISGEAIVRMAGRGDGTFEQPQSLFSGFGLVPGGAVVGDVTGDGHVDLVAVGEPDPRFNQSQIEVWVGDGNGAFEAVIGDAFIVGRMIIASQRPVDGNLLLVQETGVVKSVSFRSNGWFGPISNVLQVNLLGNPDRFVAANLNQDVTPDYVISYSGFNAEMQLYQSNSSGGFEEIVFERLGTTQSLFIADFNGDAIDEVFIEASPEAKLVHQGDDGFVIESFPVNRLSGSSVMDGVRHADLNGDGRSDLVFRNSVDNRIEIQWGRSADDGSSFAISPFIARGRDNVFSVDSQVVDGTPQFINAWIDFDQNGIWSDSEQIVDGQPITEQATHLFEYFTPYSSSLGKTWARVRISDSADLGADGITLSGEVEDYRVEIIEADAMDFGDAPTAEQSGFLSSYPTLLMDDGARHLSGGPRFSETVNTEADGVPATDASYEEWLSPVYQVQPSHWIAGETGYFSYSVLGQSGYVNAWIDLNRDGDWDDLNEHFIKGEYVAVGSGSNVTDSFASIDVPSTLAGQTTFIRVRVSTENELTPRGLAPDGEVVDLAIDIDEPFSPSAPSLILGTSREGLTTLSPQSATAFSVHLSSPPDDLFLVRLQASDPDKVAVTNRLVFGTDDWMVPQIIPVTAAEGFIHDGNSVVQLTLELLDVPVDVIDTAVLDVTVNDFPTSPPLAVHIDLPHDETIVAGPGWSVGTFLFAQNQWMRQIVRGDDLMTLGGPSLWQNPLNRFDVNRSGDISPLDALQIINEIGRRGSGDLSLGNPTLVQQNNPRFYDVSADSQVTPIDALRVINFLGRQGNVGDAEQTDFDFMLAPLQQRQGALPDSADRYDEAIATLF